MASLVLEFWQFLKVRKKWWLLPTMLVMANGRRVARARPGFGTRAVHLHDFLSPGAGSLSYPPDVVFSGRPEICRGEANGSDGEPRRAAAAPPRTEQLRARGDAHWIGDPAVKAAGRPTADVERYYLRASRSF